MKKYLNEKVLNEMSASQLSKMLTDNLELWYLPYVDDEEYRETLHQTRIQMVEALNKKILNELLDI